MKAEWLVFKNTLTLGFGKAVGDIALFVFLICFSRFFGRDALGQYAFAMSVGGLLSTLVSLGLDTYAIREISKDVRRGPEFVGKLSVLRSICALGCWGLLWLIALAMGSRPETRNILLIIGTYHFLQKLVGVFGVGFMAHEEMKFPTILSILERTIILVGGSLAIFISLSPALTLIIFPISEVIVLVTAFLIFRIRHGRPAFCFHYQFFKTAICRAGPFLVILILAQFYDRIGVIILTLMKGEAVAGIFMAGDRLLATINGFSALFATALFPAVSRLSNGFKADFERLSAWALQMVFLFLFPLATLIFIFSDQLILMAFGATFGASAAMLRIACWSLVLFGFNRILSIVLIAFYQQNRLVRIRMAAYAGYLMLSLLLVWKFSFVGLAWSKIITETAIFLLTLPWVIKVNRSVSILKRFIGPCVVSLLFVAAYSFAGGKALPAAVFFMFLFAAGAMAFKAVRLADLKALKIILAQKMGRLRLKATPGQRR